MARRRITQARIASIHYAETRSTINCEERQDTPLFIARIDGVYGPDELVNTASNVPEAV